MILIVDFDNTGQDILLTDGDSVRRFSSLPGEGFRGVDDALKALREEGVERAEGVAVVLPGKDAEGTGGRNVSWSTIRAAVALGNGLAFAWGVPAVRIDGPGLRHLPSSGTDDEGLFRTAAAALERADSDSRVSATYDGEPNITIPRDDKTSGR